MIGRIQRVRRRAAGRLLLRGVSLIELIAVAIILGVLALVVVPNVVSALGLAKSNTLKTRLAEIQTASDNFYGQVGLYPAYCQPSSSEPGRELNWAAADPFVPDYLHGIPSASPATYGLSAANGAVVYFGVDPNGLVFATQVPPNVGDPTGWDPLPTPRYTQSGTVAATTSTPAGLTTAFGTWTPLSGSWTTSNGDLIVTSAGTAENAAGATTATSFTVDFTEPATAQTLALNLINGQGAGYQATWTGSGVLGLYSGTFDTGTGLPTQETPLLNGTANAVVNIGAPQAGQSYQLTVTLLGNQEAELDLQNSAGAVVFDIAGTVSGTAPTGPFTPVLEADTGLTVTNFSAPPLGTDTATLVAGSFGAWTPQAGPWTVSPAGALSYSGPAGDGFLTEPDLFVESGSYGNATEAQMTFTEAANVSGCASTKTCPYAVVRLVDGAGDGYQAVWQQDSNFVLYAYPSMTPLASQYVTPNGGTSYTITLVPDNGGGSAGSDVLATLSANGTALAQIIGPLQNYGFGFVPTVQVSPGGDVITNFATLP